MTPGKRLTIGVTVNLERYENLRVAVEGDVETIEDAENLARYLDNVLAGFGKNDPETEKQISNYRFRVLPGRGDAANATEAGVLQEEVPRFDVDLVSDAVTAVTPASDIQKAEEADTGACTPSALAKEMSGPVCADCGTPITKQEDKLGRLFVDRPLCKSCLEALQKAQQH